MIRSRFDRELQELNTEIIKMGTLIESAIEKAVKALKDKDCDLAKEIIEFDAKIDEQEKEIQSLCLKLLLQQQPVAKDLRLISAALKMITDMERIGDQAADISELTLLLAESNFTTDMDKMEKMAEATIKMVNESINAFVNKDLELAQSVIDYDDIVDDLFMQIKSDLIELIRENKDSGESAIDLIMVAKYFERIGDHTTNIAEWVVFSITGEGKKTLYKD
jgi:phosphate transport system protein